MKKFQDLKISTFSHFANDFELKQFGWYDMDCDSESFDFFKGWYVNAKALCERDVNESGKSKPIPDVLLDVGSNGCLPGIIDYII